MTVASTTSKSGPYSGNGVTTNFAVLFKYDAKADVDVIVTSSAGVETTKTLDTHYTLTVPGDTGTVSFITTPTDFRPQTGETVTIVRTMAMIQDMDLTSGGGLSASTVEANADTQLMQIQEIAERVSRAPLLRQTSAAAPITLPQPVADNLIAWNSAGTDLENKVPADLDIGLVSPFMLTLLDDLTAAAARTTLDAQQLDADLTAIAALTTTAIGRSLLAAADAPAIAEIAGVGVTDSPTFLSLTTPLIQGGTGSGDDIRITSTSDGTKGTITLGNATTGIFYDESNERLSTGANDQNITVNGASTGIDFSIHNDEAGEVCQTVFRYSSSATRSACWWGARARGNIGAETIVQANDRLVTIQALGFDGVDYEVGAQILAEVDGTPGSNDMPTRWVFLTTPDGSATPVEAMRINSDQSVQFSTVARPDANDGAALGTATVSWSDLFIASGGVIGWNNGDVSITHSANALAFAGASSGYSFDAAVSINAGNLALPFANASIEIGNGTANTPFIDFRSSANVVDYDTRLIASGGDATLGGGFLGLIGTLEIDPRAASLKRGFVVTQSGAGSSAGNFAFNDIRIDEEEVDGGAGAAKIDGLQIVHLYGGAAMRGGRHGLEVTSVLNSPSHASNPDRNYVGAAFTGLANSDDGGGVGTELGAFFGINAQAAAFSGATNLSNISAAEFNTSVQTGASVRYKSLIQLCGRDDDVVQGSTYDVMLALSNQTTAVKWEDGILIGNMNGSFPIDSSGSVIRATAGSVTKGIDLSALTISGNAFASPNFTLAGTGNISMGAQLTTGQGISTGDASMELGGSRTGDGNCYIDFHATSGSDYECRFLRNGGANGAASFANAGTGDFSFTQEGAGALSFKTSNAEKVRITAPGNMKIGGAASRATTEGTNQLVIFNGTAPVGALTNGVSLYSSGGKLFAKDAGGTATQLTP